MNDALGTGLPGLAGFMVKLIFRARLKLAALGILFALIAFLLAGTALLGQAVAEATATWTRRLGADIMVIPAGNETRLEQGLIGGVPVRFSLPPETEAAVAALPGVQKAAPQYFLSSSRSSCCEAGDLLLVGFDPDRDFTVLPWLQGSRGVQPGEGDVLIGGGVMKGRGAELRLYNRTFTVAARLEKSGMGYFDNAVFISLKGVAAMEQSSRGTGKVPLTVTWGRPSLVLVQLAPRVKVQAAAALIRQRVPGVQVLTMSDLFREKREKMARFVAVQKPIAAAAWLFALTAGGAAQLIYWRERRPTLGLLQAWGCSKGAILITTGLETLLLSLITMAAGSLGAYLLLRLFTADWAALLGLPLLLGAGAVSAAGVPWLCFAFAGAMAGETVIIMLLLLRREAADLMRGA